MTQNKLSAVEHIKQKSKGLRGTLAESLSDEITGSLREDDQSLVKFHGMYQQDDRDRREEREKKKLERLYSYMVRLRLPGGELKASQYCAIHDIAGKYSTGVIKVTTRQTIQLHGILKAQVKPTLKAFDHVLLDAIAACGDVNRNVICSNYPITEKVHEEVYAYASKISEFLKPKTRAYYEVFLDEEKIAEKVEEDPLYQDRYLPRKFKIAIAIPPNNDVDVFANDIGLIAIIENGKLLGFNLAVGGGLSSTHGNAETYPRLATVIGFVAEEEQIMKAVYEVLTIQRDYGNRADRKRARLKYTIDTMGVDVFKEELEKRIGFQLLPAHEVRFNDRKDIYGWQKDVYGKWNYTLFLENGRILDEEDYLLKSALLKIAETEYADFKFTASQNLILSGIAAKQKSAIAKILSEFKISDRQESLSAIRKSAMACVALPTCPLALAEAQRYLPELITKVEQLLKTHNLYEEAISIRMTGCPNGCARSYLAEIGLIGTGKGRYNLNLGGDRVGERLNKIYALNVSESEILNLLNDVFAKYSAVQNEYATFGDFCFKTVV